MAVDSIAIRFHPLPGAQRGGGEIRALWPGRSWSETSVFADSTTFEPRPVRGTVLPGRAAMSRDDSTGRIRLPTSFFSRAAEGNPPTATVQVLLEPSPLAAGDFLLVAASDDAEALGRRPRAVFYRSSSGIRDSVVVDVTADTYFAERVGPPPEEGLLIETGVFYSLLLRFALPDSIPRNATVNRADLTVDVLQERSLFGTLRFQVDRVEVAGADTAFVRPSQSNFYVRGITSEEQRATVRLDRFLVQSWVSGNFPNHGMALRPQFDEIRYEWAVLKNPTLRLVYSTPPGDGQ